MATRILSGVLAVGLASSLFAADWPQYGGPARNSVSPETGLLAKWPAEGPQVLWSVPANQGFGGAAISGGQVFILDREGTTKDVLRCLDIKSGKELWNYAYDAPGKYGFPGSRSVPAVTDKYVFIAGPFGHIHCIDRQTHAPVWKADVLEGAKTPPWATTQNPLLYDDLVVVSSLSRGLVAFEQATGKPKWTAAEVKGSAYCSPSLIEIAGRPQVAIVNGSGVQGVDAKTGKLLWTFAGFKCSIPIPNVTPVGASQLFVTGGYKSGSVLIDLKPADGGFAASEVWRIPQGSQIHQPIVVGDRIYLNGNTNETRDNILCLDAKTGKVIYQAKEPNIDRANLTMADGKLYFIDAGGTLHLADPSGDSLKLISSAKLLAPKDIWAPIAVSDGIMVIRDQKQMKALKVKQ